MELWIRSTNKTNLLKANFLSVMEGSNFYDRTYWEYKGYTIVNCTGSGKYNILGTYKTKERALEVLDEIQKYITPTLSLLDDTLNGKQVCQVGNILTMVYEMPKE